MSGIGFVEDSTGGVSVVLDGHPQSYVHPDPQLLAFEYVQHLAACVDALAPPAPQPLAITHVGGGGLTLPRYVQHTRPNSPQIVLEPEAELTAAVRERLPLPRRHRIRVRAVDGRSGLAALRDAGADVLVLDAFAFGCVPAELTTAEAFAQVTRVLRSTGVFLANLTDEPNRAYLARVAATAHAAGLRHQAALATHDVLKGRRFGNTVLAASAVELPVAQIRRHLARGPFPSGVLSDADLARRRAGARPLTDVESAPSPPAPDPGAWRAR